MRQHSSIWFSPAKEAMFRALEDTSAYRELFTNVTTQRAIGEASANYLYSGTAAARIEHSNLDKPIPDREVRTRLMALFREDALRLQDMTGKDLSDWLKVLA
jgi:hypothetical protein